MHFYPRPVLAFGYCRCLRVCVCVCLSVNHQLVRAVTRQPFKLEPPNLDQRCKRPWLRSLLFFWAVDLELQGQIELKCQNLPHFELVRAISHHQLETVFPNFGQKCIFALLRSLSFGDHRNNSKTAPISHYLVRHSLGKPRFRWCIDAIFSGINYVTRHYGISSLFHIRTSFVHMTYQFAHQQAVSWAVNGSRRFRDYLTLHKLT